jgi:hypothetical protein
MLLISHLQTVSVVRRFAISNHSRQTPGHSVGVGVLIILPPPASPFQNVLAYLAIRLRYRLIVSDRNALH